MTRLPQELSRAAKDEVAMTRDDGRVPSRTGWLKELVGRWITLPGTQGEAATSRLDGPARTRAGLLNELWAQWISNNRLGNAVGRWLARMIALPQLRRLAGGAIPWTPLRKPVSECTVVLVTTAGVHLRSDRPFNLNGDSSFRVIPKDAQPGDLAISHQA